MRAVLPGKPQAKLQALSTAQWNGQCLVAYISGNGFIVLSGPSSLLQTTYLDQCDALDALSIDDRSGKIAVCSRDEIFVYRPYGREEGFLKWSLQLSLSVFTEYSNSPTLSWGSEEELLAGSTFLRLYRTAKNGRKVWDRKLAKPVKIATFSPDASLVASTGWHDRLVKVWRRQSFDSDDTRFEFTYLSHPSPITQISWRKPPPHEHHHNEQSVDNVLLSVCTDGRIRIWAATDPHGLQGLQLWAEIDMQQSIQSRRLGITSDIQERFAFFINSHDFRHCASDILNVSGNSVDADHAVEHLAEISKRKPDVCVVLDWHGNMSAWGLESIGCKTRKGTEIFNIAHMEDFPLFPVEIRNHKSNVTFVNFSDHTAPSKFSLLTHFFDGHIMWHQSTFNEMFDSSPRSTRSSIKALWAGHCSPIEHMVHGVNGHNLLTVSDDKEAIFWTERAANNSYSLIPESSLDSSQNIMHSCLLNDNSHIVNLYSDRLALLDTSKPFAEEITSCPSRPDADLSCLLQLGSLIGNARVHYIAGITVDLTGLVWRISLLEHSTDISANGASNICAITQVCKFDLGIGETVEHIIPIDRGDSSSRASSIEDLSINVLLSCTKRGILRTWTAAIEPQSAIVKWHQSSVLFSEITAPSLVAASSNLKVALVGATRRQLFIWDMRSSYLEYVFECDPLQTITDLRWSLTRSSTVLAVSLAQSIIIVAQQRFDYSEDILAWVPIHKVSLKELSSNPISHITWLQAQKLVIAAGRQLFVHDTRNQQDEIDSNSMGGSQSWNTSLPVYHPAVLDQLFLAGRFPEVNGVIFTLYEMLKYFTPGDQMDPFLALPLENFFTELAREQSFLKSWNDADDEAGAINEDRAMSLRETLSSLNLPQLSSNHQSDLVHVIKSLALARRHSRSLDICGLKYYTIFTLYLFRKVTRSMRSTEMLWREYAWASHSNSHDILIDLVSRGYQGSLTWGRAKESGMFLWLSDRSALEAQLEVVARNEYTKTDEKNPINCSLYYFALRKKSVLLGLWRIAHGNREQAGTQKLLKNNFSEDRWKSAALKNAYALLGKRRFEYAAAWFLLADRLKDTVNICVNQIGDIQLAIAIARVYAGDDSSVFRSLVKDHILPEAAMNGNRWQAHWAFWILRKPDLAIRALLEPLEALVFLNQSSKVQAKSYINNEPARLVLYRQLRDQRLQARKPLPIPRQKEWTFVLQTALQYCRMGCDILALDLVRNWKFVEQHTGVLTDMDHASKADKEARRKSRRKSSLVPKTPKSSVEEKPKPTMFKEPEGSSLLDNFGF
ncbi:uncharacterized protein KY384_007091 [Bacidia gigantensis]|uniref:uncharacterized protein n=1 Tax=Bacidia gigantensis TaxID=2732470 RepID=UPI001D054395|nr:uncharacterized protein KY384_007091 [Bacidia gigantensis]KAG8528174.1 hypothetical protein KY384_007091 [Bacidia gigantensis]